LSITRKTFKLKCIIFFNFKLSNTLISGLEAIVGNIVNEVEDLDISGYIFFAYEKVKIKVKT